MMQRNRSQSGLSRARSKDKIRQAISDAMGRPQEQYATPQKPHRSESTKSLRSFNGSLINNSLPYSYSSITKKHSQKELITEKVRVTEKSIMTTPTILSWEWWHHQNYKLITQQKVKQAKGRRQSLKYFAMEQADSTKKIIFAAQNDQIFLGYPELEAVIIDWGSRRAAAVRVPNGFTIPPDKESSLLLFEDARPAPKSIRDRLEEELQRKDKKVDAVLDQLLQQAIEGKIGAKFLLMVKYSLDKGENGKGQKQINTLREVLKTDLMRIKFF